jgi:hypothetical protein
MLGCLLKSSLITGASIVFSLARSCRVRVLAAVEACGLLVSESGSVEMFQALIITEMIGDFSRAGKRNLENN